MKARLLRSCVAAGAALLFLAAPRASADTITLYFAGTTGATPVSTNLNGTGHVVTPGPYFWHTTPPPNAGAPPVATFCIEVTQSAPVLDAATTFTVTDLGSSSLGAQAGAIMSLYGNKGGYSDAVFQLALWELVYDGVADTANPGNPNFFASGNLHSVDANVANAQALLGTALGNIPGGVSLFNTNYPGYSLVTLTNPNIQDQIDMKPQPGAVPAPPAILLAAVGLLALGGRSRWNRNAPGTA
jgi:hypothetical protein